MRAINIALLPDEQTTRLAILLSRQLDGSIVLGEQATPHITLLQGGTHKVHEVCGSIDEMASTHRRMNLEITGLGQGRLSSIHYLTVAKSPELAALHERIVAEIMPHMTYEVEGQSFAEADENAVRNLALHPVKAIKENYRPHISLGFGALTPAFRELRFPMSFQAEEIAVYHLGRAGTCHTQLYSKKLL